MVGRQGNVAVRHGLSTTSDNAADGAAFSAHSHRAYTCIPLNNGSALPVLGWLKVHSDPP